MNGHDLQHLTADELDLLVAGVSAPRAMSHCETCPECHRLLELDPMVVHALSTATRPDPAPGFTDRVMARVTVGALPTPATVSSPTPRELAARRRVLVGSLLTGGVVAAGFVWAAANPAAAGKLATPALQDVGQSLWLWLQTVAANAVDQPWFGAARDAVGTPIRAIAVLGAVAGLYALTLTGLRHLLAEPASDAGW